MKFYVIFVGVLVSFQALAVSSISHFTLEGDAALDLYDHLRLTEREIPISNSQDHLFEKNSDYITCRKRVIYTPGEPDTASCQTNEQAILRYGVFVVSEALSENIFNLLNVRAVRSPGSTLHVEKSTPKIRCMQMEERISEITEPIRTRTVHTCSVDME